MPPSEQLWVLVYVSTATAPFSQESLQKLLSRSRLRNSTLGISGLLAYHEGTFMQALEGPREHVASVYARIAQDPRHHGAIVLIDAAIEERQFGAWAMAYQQVSDASPPDGYHGLLERHSTVDDFRGHPDRVHRLLQGFADRQLRRASSGA